MPAPIVLAISLTNFIWLVVALFIMFSVLSGVVLSLTWLERKLLGRLQLRLGPTRTGPMGLLQPMADALKLILKEDIIPASSEKALFWVAPIIVVVSAFMIWVTIPGTQNAVIQNLDLGLFYVIAFSVVGILGLVLAGWGSANKYGTLGGLRAAAQLISYEIPIIMVAISVGMLAQSLDLREIVNQQDNYISFWCSLWVWLSSSSRAWPRSDGRLSTSTSPNQRSSAGPSLNTAALTGRSSSWLNTSTPSPSRRSP